MVDPNYDEKLKRIRENIKMLPHLQPLYDACKEGVATFDTLKEKDPGAKVMIAVPANILMKMLEQISYQEELLDDAEEIISKLISITDRSISTANMN